MKTARLILLNAQAGAALHSLRVDDLEPFIAPGLRPLAPLVLSEFGAPCIDRSSGAPIDWPRLADALWRLVQAAGDQAGTGEAPAQTLLAGQGPLPLFVLAGQLLASVRPLTLVNWPRTGPPDVLTLDDSVDGASVEPFDDVRGMPDEPVRKSGWLALAVTRRGVPIDESELSTYCDGAGCPIGHVVHLASRQPLRVDRGNFRATLRQLDELLPRLPGLFPERDGLALFVEGPATLAFLLGRALNPGAQGRPILVPDHGSGRYEAALTLPWVASPSPPLPVAQPITAPSAQATILYFSANPDDPEGRHLPDGAEARAIDKAIQAARYRDLLRLKQHPATRPKDLLTEIRSARPHVVHFGGHACAEGLILMRDPELHLLSQREPAVEHHVVPNEALVEMFAALKVTPRLVVLSACDTDALAEALTSVVDCVVGMPQALEDRAACAFAAALYGALAWAESVQTAFSQARAQLRLDALGVRPELYVRQGIDAARVFLVHEAT